MFILLVGQLASLDLFYRELKDKMSTGIVPWWHELYKIFPMVGEAGMLLLFGLLAFISRLTG